MNKLEKSVLAHLKNNDFDFDKACTNDSCSGIVEQILGETQKPLAEKQVWHFEKHIAPSIEDTISEFRTCCGYSDHIGEHVQCNKELDDAQVIEALEDGEGGQCESCQAEASNVQYDKEKFFRED